MLITSPFKTYLRVQANAAARASARFDLLNIEKKLRNIQLLLFALRQSHAWRSCQIRPDRVPLE